MATSRNDGPLPRASRPPYAGTWINLGGTLVDSLSIDLPGSEISAIRMEHQELRICFSRAYLTKTLTGSVERTRWWQAGDLVLEDPRLDGEPPAGPLVCAGGEVEENIYTYVDMIPVPLDSRGHGGCRLRFQDRELEFSVQGRAIRLEMRDVPRYIEHLRPG